MSRLTDEDGVQPQPVHVLSDLEMRTRAYGVPESNKRIRKEGMGVGLSVGLNCSSNVARQTVEGLFGGVSGPAPTRQMRFDRVMAKAARITGGFVYMSSNLAKVAPPVDCLVYCLEGLDSLSAAAQVMQVYSYTVEALAISTDGQPRAAPCVVIQVIGDAVKVEALVIHRAAPHARWSQHGFSPPMSGFQGVQQERKGPIAD